MTTDPSARHVDIPQASKKKLDVFYELVDGIKVAMMTTRRQDGHLVSRRIQTQDRREIADLWFITCTS